MPDFLLKSPSFNVTWSDSSHSSLVRKTLLIGFPPQARLTFFKLPVPISKFWSAQIQDFVVPACTRHVSLLSAALTSQPPSSSSPSRGRQERNPSPETTSDGKRSCLQVCSLTEHGNGLQGTLRQSCRPPGKLTQGHRAVVSHGSTCCMSHRPETCPPQHGEAR